MMTLLIISSPSSFNNSHRAPVFPLMHVYARFSLPQGALANVTTSPVFSWALLQLPSALLPKRAPHALTYTRRFSPACSRGKAAGEDEEETGRRGTWTKAKFSCGSSRRQKNRVLGLHSLCCWARTKGLGVQQVFQLRGCADN